MNNKVEFKSKANLERNEQNFQIRVYEQETERGIKEHVAIIKGDVTQNINNIIRVHSSCVTSEVFGCSRCDCAEQLDTAFEEISKSDAGAIIYLDQEGRDIGLAKKVEAYSYQDQGFNTVEANIKCGVSVDNRNYGPALQILEDIGITKTALLTNNPNKVTELVEGGITVSERIPVITPTKSDYLNQKSELLNHELDFDSNRDRAITAQTINGFKPYK